jgi:hypothetical protein
VEDVIGFNFGTIEANDYGLLIFEIVGLVVDHPNNTNGNDFLARLFSHSKGDTFPVTLTYSHSENGDTYSTSQTLEFRILEPDLILTLDQNVTFLFEGIPVLFTVEIRHTINSTGNAYSTTVLAVLPSVHSLSAYSHYSQYLASIIHTFLDLSKLHLQLILMTCQMELLYTMTRFL